MSRRPNHRPADVWHRCSRKKRYASLEDAKKGCDQHYLFTHGDMLESYACPYCDGFHNGHGKHERAQAHRGELCHSQG